MGADLKRLIGTKLRLARTRQRLTQEAVGELIDRTTESVSNIERGRTLPTLETLGRLAKVLSVPLREFFDDEPELSHRSKKRMEFELKVRDQIRGLSDKDIEILAEQIEVLRLCRASRPLLTQSRPFGELA